MNPRARRLLVPGISALVMFVILIGLGTWQVQRLGWKRGLLADIDRAEALPGVAMPDHPAQFTKVRVTGRFRDDLLAYYGVDVRQTRDGAEMGAQLIQPLIRPAGPQLLVDRGWVPTERQRPIALPAGEVTLEGYIRVPDHAGLFSPADDVTGRHFYTLDPGAIGAALGLDTVAPYTLVVLGEPPPEGYPDPARRLPRPPNDHLSYAITWYGLALTLLVIFVVYARKAMGQPMRDTR